MDACVKMQKQKVSLSPLTPDCAIWKQPINSGTLSSNSANRLSRGDLLAVTQQQASGVIAKIRLHVQSTIKGHLQSNQLIFSVI